ncbi:MAG TPA: MFS transporter [Pseudolabrys sp.]|nr:MFS transporter [Pseudolabrys sp.]
MSPPVSVKRADRALTRSIAFLALAGFAAQSMVRVSDSLLPQIASDLSVTVGAASVVVTAYAFAHGSVQLVIGPVGDRFGKYICMASAAAVASVLTFLCGLAQSLPALVAARLACGLSAGWIVPLALAFIGDVIPYERRQAVIGRFLSGQILGQLFGQAAGGVLGDLFGWRRVFFLLAGMFAVATIALFVEWARNPLTHAASALPGRSHGFVAGYSAVLGSRFARLIILFGFLEAGLLFGSFTYVGADLHLRFGVGFALVGLFVGFFAIGGLIYSLSVVMLVRKLGQTGLITLGGAMLLLAYTSLALEPIWWLTPLSIVGIGLGFYMLHNTLQTNATQMTPQARGTAVAVFSSALYLGQTAGVSLAALVFDRHGGVPVFVAAGVLLLALALWFRRELLAREAEQRSTV